MILERIYEPQLAQAGYLVGCPGTGEALVIDPNRDVGAWQDLAERLGLRIVAVTETHIHADYVSGSRELAERTGARLYLSDEGNSDWKYAFASQPNVTLVRDGDVIDIGAVKVQVVATPGHTPEHICFLLTDTAASSHPVALLTGDFVFVGDVGRPDLLERAANISGVMEPSARKLFESLKWFRSLPDGVLVWPAHGAGSACGKSLGGMPATSVGYEKHSNWALAIEDQEEFVKRVLEGQPDPPRYFAQMKRVNKEGPRILGGFHTPPRLAPEAIFELLDRDALIFDLRPDKEYAGGHIPGTLGMQMCRSFLQYAGWFVRYDQPTYLIANDAETVQAAVRDLALIGADDIAGWFGEDVLAEYTARRGKLATHVHVTHDEALQLVRTSHAQIVDVRSPSEYAAAHMPDAMNVPYYRIEQYGETLRKDRPVVVYCNSGGRSAIAASLLSNAGFERVHDLNAGFGAYVASGGPTETQSPQPREPVTT